MKKIKNLKPISFDLNLKYKCAECGFEHWISLLESQTKEFVIVCPCGTLLKPKTISNISVKYLVEENNSKPTSTSTDNNDLNVSQIEAAITTLSNYGFTHAEAKSLIKETLAQHKVTDISDLIKTCLTNFGAAK